jgi:hypothetical protein
MALRLNTAKQVATAAAAVADLTVLEVYSGTQPGSANNAASGTLLVTFTGIAWNTTNNPATLAAAPYTATVAASGTAGWGRFRNAGNTLRLDGAVGAEFTLGDTSLAVGNSANLIAAAVTKASGE